MEKIYEYTVIYEPADEGGYIVSVPALPGCHTQGETLIEAKEIAIEGYLASLQKDGLPIPNEDKTITNMTLADRIFVSI